MHASGRASSAVSDHGLRRNSSGEGWLFADVRRKNRVNETPVLVKRGKVGARSRKKPDESTCFRRRLRADCQRQTRGSSGQQIGVEITKFDHEGAETRRRTETIRRQPVARRRPSGRRWTGRRSATHKFGSNRAELVCADLLPVRRASAAGPPISWIRCPCFSLKSVVAWTCLPHVRDLFGTELSVAARVQRKTRARTLAISSVAQACGLELTSTGLAKD